MKAYRPPLPSHTSSRLRRRWAGPLLALLAAATPVKADHLYNAWTQQFDLNAGFVAQESSAVATDSHGNVIVAGQAFNSGGVRQWYVAKYDALDGELIAGGIVLGPSKAGPSQNAPVGDSFIKSIAVDSQDNVYVAGGTTLDATKGEDIELMKLNRSLQPLWAATRANDGQDELEKVVLDNAGNPYVTGFIAISGQGQNILTIEYSPGGALLHQVQYNSNGNIDDSPADMAISSDGGRIYVVGTSRTNAGKVLTTLLYDNTLALSSFFPVTHQPTSGDSTAIGVTTDVGGNAYVTATDVDVSGDQSLYTVKYNATGIPFWQDNYSIRTDDTDARAGGISIGPDNDPVVTGVVDAGGNNGTTLAVTIKYQGSSIPGVTAGTRVWVAKDAGISPEDPNFKGFPQFNTSGEKVFVDAGGNVNVVGESAASDDGEIIYVARYNGADGTLFFNSAFDNGITDHQDVGVGIANDATGNLVITGTLERPETPPAPGTDPTGPFIHSILTQKFQRLIAETNDVLPADLTGNVARKVSILNAPALADSGDIAARITYAEGKSKLTGILTQGPEGGSVLPVVQKMAAPGVTGASFATFADPVISPDGHYAFPATLAGVPAAKAKSLWTNLGGTLHLALQEGSPVPGVSTANVASITSIALRDSQLLALIKVSGAATTNTLLLSLDSGNIGTQLLRTGEMQTVNGVTSAVKSITMLTPSPNSAGDGRWQGDADVVVKAVMSDKAKSTVIFKITPGGAVTPLLFTGQDATAFAGSTDTWATFNLPAVGPTGIDFAALGTLKTSATVKAATENVIVLNTGTGFKSVAREGNIANAATFLGNVSYVSFSNPVADKTGEVAFLSTIKALPIHTTTVTAANNRVLLYGNASALSTVARTGEKAPDITGTATTAAFSSFVSFALPGGTPSGLGVPLVQLMPIFVAKISGKGVTAKNNLGVWGVDSTSTLRCLLHTGEKLGTQTVTNITLLKAPAQAFAAARSFNTFNSVVMLVAFSDHTSGILEVQIP